MSKPDRPYSEYNIFFQLEREYILQVELGFRPDYDLSEIFDPADTINYHGPALPSKYSHLIYLKDWHLPGKRKRRKRRHRRSHGKIGFHELSLKIAASWKSVDSETRFFCAELGSIGMRQYKCEINAYKMLNSQSNKEELSKPDKKLTLKKIEPKLNKIDVLNEDVVKGEIMPSQVKISAIFSDNSRFAHTERCVTEGVDVAGDNVNTPVLPEVVRLSMERRDTYMTASLEDSHHSSEDLDCDVLIGGWGSSDGLCFVPTEKCTMQDVDAAFDKDILHTWQGLVEPCLEHCISDISFYQSHLSMIGVDGHASTGIIKSGLFIPFYPM